jgi:hypothetical protein
MKNLICFNFLIFGFGLCFAQQASDYFPEHPEVRWEYKITPLDSSNNPVTTLSYYRHDRFFAEADFDGKPAKILQTKSGPMQTIQFQPYLDSLFFYFEGATAYEHFKVGYVGFLFEVLDSVLDNPHFSFVEFLHSLEKWYPVYRFAQSINDEYTILRVDTTVSFDSVNIPLRFEYLGVRLADEMLHTPIADFGCKKFIRRIDVSYLFTPPPPFPVIPVPIFSLNDTVWIAPGHWMVKGVIPVTNIDLGVINIDVPPFYIPGLVTELDGFVITSVKGGEELFIPDKIALSQNYPNPFNPTTTIRYQLPGNSKVAIGIYNILGEQVRVLVDGIEPAGERSIDWDSRDEAGNVVPSGVYLYRLTSGEFVQTRKMVLMK